MPDHPAPSDERLNEFKPWRLWLIEDAETVFPTQASFEWFLRKQQRRLVDSGQFIPRRGPGGGLAGPRLGAVVLEILREEALEQVSRDNVDAA
ncbi:MAG: hypothetical protein ACLFTD_13630 [Halochromatium sp.]